MASYLLITNPAAGRGAGAARAESLRAELARDHEVELAETSARGDATELAQTRGAAADRIIAIGGDGTLNEVLVGLMRIGEDAETRPSLGYLPGGTANVASGVFGLTPDPVLLARKLETCQGRLADVGVAELDGEERPFLLWCGAGLDAVVIDELNSTRTGHMGLIGLAGNVPRVMSAVRRYDAPAVSVVADGEELSPAATVVLANIGHMAFGGVVHPDASPFDGLLDVVAVEQKSPIGLLVAAVRMMFSSLTASRGVVHRTAGAVTLASEGRVPVQLDGEPVGHLPVSVRLEKAAVRMLVDDAE